MAAAISLVLDMITEPNDVLVSTACLTAAVSLGSRGISPLRCILLLSVGKML